MTLVAHRARSRESARGRCERARREVRLEATFRHLRADGNNTATPRPAAGSTTTAAVPRKCRKMRTRADGTRFARRHARPRIVHDTTRRRARRVRRVTSRASRRADGDDDGDNRRARSRARDRAFCRWKIDAVGARRSLSCQCATSSPRTRAFGLPRDPEPARRRPRLLARHDARDGRRWRRLGRERNPPDSGPRGRRRVPDIRGAGETAQARRARPPVSRRGHHGGQVRLRRADRRRPGRHHEPRSVSLRLLLPLRPRHLRLPLRTQAPVRLLRVTRNSSRATPPRKRRMTPCGGE